MAAFISFALGNLPPVIDVILSEEWFKPSQITLVATEKDFDVISDIGKAYKLSFIRQATDISEAANG